MDVHLHPTTTGQLFDGLSSSRKQIIFLIGPVLMQTSQSWNSIGWIQILKKAIGPRTIRAVLKSACSV